jgi:hypothetical protein
MLFAENSLKQKHRMPPMPILNGLIEKYNFFLVRKKYFDENWEVKPDAPNGLKEEIALLRSGKY